MIGFLIGIFSVPAVAHANRWYIVTFIDLPKVSLPSPLIIVPESDRNPVPGPGGSGPSGVEEKVPTEGRYLGSSQKPARW